MLHLLVECRNNKFQLEEINILDIKSYALQDAIFKPISWQIALGGKRIFNDELNTYIQAGGGIAIGDEKLFTYATVTPTVYYKTQTEQSIAINLGLLYNPSKNLKLGLLAKHEQFNKKRTIQELEPFVTYSFDQTSALNLKYKYKNFNGIIERDASLSWFWYF